MSDYITVGGVVVGGANTNIYVLDCNDDDAPEPDYEAVSIPGRSGDLHIWNERWKNKQVTYRCVCMKNASTVIPALITQLLAQYGYQRITDTLHDDYYKLGEFVGATNINYAMGRDAARFNLTFDCKPQKWLISGDTAITITSATTITNPTPFPAYPLLKLNGRGTVTLNHVNSSPAVSYTIKSTRPVYSGATFSFDCDLMDGWPTAYPTINDNGYITLSGTSGRACLQGNGDTQISFSTADVTSPLMTKVIVTPRWYKL